MRLTVANILTMGRLVLAPLFVVSFLLDQKLLAVVLFCVAGFTDLIDGTIARLLKQRSKIGALMDPIADKLLVQGCFIMLFIAGLIPWWFFVLALFRDIMIVGGIIYLELVHAALPYGPTWVSKFATLFQLGVAVIGLVRWLKPEYDLATWHSRLIIITAILILVSGFKYVLMGVDILKEHRGKKLDA